MVTEDDFGIVAFVATDRENAIIADAAISAGAHDFKVTMDHKSFADGAELADYVTYNAKLAQSAAIQFLAESNRQLRIYAGDNPAVVLTQEQFELLLVIADAYFDDDEGILSDAQALSGVNRIGLALCATDRDKVTDFAVAVRQALEYERGSTALSRAHNGQGAKNG